MLKGVIVLAYQDARIARQIPGSDQDFVLKSYKEWLGRSYSRLTLYLSPISNLEEVQEYGIAMGTPFAVTVANVFMYLHEKDIVERYSSYLILYNTCRFIDDILAIWNGPKDTLLEFLDTLGSKTDRIKLTVLAIVASPFWICFSIEIFHQMYCIFLLFRSLLTNICIYLSSRFTLLAIRKPLLRGN